MKKVISLLFGAKILNVPTGTSVVFSLQSSGYHLFRNINLFHGDVYKPLWQTQQTNPATDGRRWPVIKNRFCFIWRRRDFRTCFEHHIPPATDERAVSWTTMARHFSRRPSANFRRLSGNRRRIRMRMVCRTTTSSTCIVQAPIWRTHGDGFDDDKR